MGASCDVYAGWPFHERREMHWRGDDDLVLRPLLAAVG